MILKLLRKLKLWIDYTIVIYAPIALIFFAALILTQIFNYELNIKAKEFMGVFIAIALYTLAIAIQLKEINADVPVFPYSRLELFACCMLYAFFHIWLLVVLISAFLPNGLPERLKIPHVVLYLMASPAIYFVSRDKKSSVKKTWPKKRKRWLWLRK